MVSLQGPRSRDVTSTLELTALDTLPYFSVPRARDPSSGAESRDSYDLMGLDSYIVQSPPSKEKDHHCGYRLNLTTLSFSYSAEEIRLHLTSFSLSLKT